MFLTSCQEMETIQCKNALIVQTDEANRLDGR